MQLVGRKRATSSWLRRAIQDDSSDESGSDEQFSDDDWEEMIDGDVQRLLPPEDLAPRMAATKDAALAAAHAHAAADSCAQEAAADADAR